MLNVCSTIACMVPTIYYVMGIMYQYYHLAAAIGNPTKVTLLFQIKLDLGGIHSCQTWTVSLIKHNKYSILHQFICMAI